MPHSSGGGHSHSGSHSSSKGADMRYGKKYYRGSNRYVYYLNGAPQYYFSDKPYTLQTSKSEKIRKIFMNIFSIILGAIFAVTGFNMLPHKVKLDYNTDILINDSANLLSAAEQGEMKEAFTTFQKKTGVTPAFSTIVDTELEKQGGDLYKYSLNLYTKTFDDEKHWLVVYCIDDEEEYWQWEGIIGDDCGSMITTDLENEFTTHLQNNLQNNPKMIAASVIDTFETIGNKSGKIQFSKIPFFALCVFGAGFYIFLSTKKIITTSKEKAEDDPRINAVQCPTAEAEPETAKCQYCDGEFVVGLHTECPHCGAPIENWE